MQNTIFECYEFHKLEECLEKYMSLINAIDENYSIKILGLYESNLSEGLFVHCKLEISIPTNGIYAELDVRSDEEILMYARTDYPFSAPAVLFVRNDFPTNKIAHLNLGVADSKIHLLNPCLYRGDIDEWFYQNGPRAFCDRVNEWFSDLVNGELMNGDGFETIRYEDADSIVEVDFDYLVDMIQTHERGSGAYVLAMERFTDRYFKVTNKKYSKQSKKPFLPCLFVFDREKVVKDYLCQSFTAEKDLKIFPCECKIWHGIRMLRSKYYEPKTMDSLENLLVIMAVKRPMQVIGGFSDYEFVAVLLSYNFKESPVLENCEIQKMAVIQSLNRKMAERLSGTEMVKKKPVVLLGCGALGSKISMNLARMGYTEQHLYDNDILLPHNLVRHYENSSYAIGRSKADVIKQEMNLMFNNDSVSYNGNIFHIEELPEGLPVDCTASKRSLFWSVSSRKIKSPMLRTEIYMGGKIGLILLEGKNRNPDVYDIQVSLYRTALDETLISQWLNYKQAEDMRYHIGFGCSSDTTILDDATISNHASIVPHLINKYQETENGIACVNYFDMDNLTNNRLYIYEIEPMMFLQEVDGWSIHIRCSLYQKIQEYSKQKLENAGIWIGSIEAHIKRITVVDTFIPEDNDREADTVTMGKSGVKRYLKTLTVRTNGLLRYIGEWHTHTSGDASLSQCDVKTFEGTQPDTNIFLMTIISPLNTRNYIIKRKKK